VGDREGRSECGPIDGWRNRGGASPPEKTRKEYINTLKTKTRLKIIRARKRGAVRGAAVEVTIRGTTEKEQSTQ